MACQTPSQTLASLSVVLILHHVTIGSSYEFPFQDPAQTWADRVDDLVGRLTLDEITTQTIAIYGKPTPGVERLGIKPYVWISECLSGHASTNGTAFPQALGLAATFSPELVRDVAEAVSLEVRAHWNGNLQQGRYLSGQGLSCFSPVINIMRHPLWGRNQETYGEDPFLSGSLAQGYVQGLQGDDPRYVRANAGCKHFDVHGGPENIPSSRHSFDAKVSTFDFRMTFLPQFKMCVDAGSYSLMCSYNRLNGVPACANKELLTDITRSEWGFSGFIVSDSMAIKNVIRSHHYLKTPVEVVAASIKAGCNLELGSTVFESQSDAVRQGKLTEKELRDNVKPLFMTRMRLGEFDPKAMNPYNKIDYSVIQSQQHRDLAIKAAMKSFVLLKNEKKFLPLEEKVGSVALVGPFANDPVHLYGNWAARVSKKYLKTPKETLSALGHTATFAKGCSSPKCTQYEAESVRTAVMGADLVVVCLGTGEVLESEGNDRQDLALPGKQLQLLKDITKFNSRARILLLLFNAGPLDVSWAQNNPQVGAIMACFFPAQSTGEALYNVLTSTKSDHIPAGRLPATWPANMKQVPPMEDYTMKGRTYRYYNGEPLYPFGYGLSYSSFQYISLSTTPKAIQPNKTVKVQVKVKNMGPYDADEVVQVYMSWPTTGLPPVVQGKLPKYQLVGFRRQTLAVGKETEMVFEITAEQMLVWMDDTSSFKILQGHMTLHVGGQQPGQKQKINSNTLTSSFLIQGQEDSSVHWPIRYLTLSLVPKSVRNWCNESPYLSFFLFLFICFIAFQAFRKSSFYTRMCMCIRGDKSYAIKKL